jgi:hypothetical protein
MKLLCQITVLTLVVSVAVSATAKEAVIPLDNIGVADSKFLNPRRPYNISGAIDYLRFDNRTIDREFDVKFEVHRNTSYVDAPPLTNRSDESVREWRASVKRVREETVTEAANAIRQSLGAENSKLLDIDSGDCKLDDDAGEVRCSSTLRVLRFRKVSLPADFIENHLKNERDEVFEIKVSFRNDIEEPANSTAYITFGGKESGNKAVRKERESELTWTPSAAVGAHFDLSLPLKEKDEKQVPILSKELPFTGRRQGHVSGAAQLDLDYVLTTFADVETTFTFKDGDLGDEEAGTDVTASKYKFKLYNSNGTTLHFGKFDFASPANKIAVNERGEGILLDLGAMNGMKGNPSFGYIAKRENTTPFGDEDQDAHSLVFQWNNVPTPTVVHVLRTFHLLAIYGEDDTHDDSHNYRTFGAEIVGGTTLRKRSLTGSAAHYRSRRTGLPNKRGKGDVTLLTLTLNLLRAEETAMKASHSVQLLLGRGSADNPQTEQIESYVGETQAFAPDTLFLSSLADPLVEGGEVLVGNGLGNKLYAGLQYTTDQFSLLDQIARLLKMDAAVESKSTTIALHAYRFRGYLEGPRNAGWEADLEFGLEASKGIKTSMGVAYLFSGDALAVEIPKNVWAVTAKISVEP